jgi:hypothetical protein
MTAADLLALLQAHPAEAIEAIGQLKIAAAWEDERTGFYRYPHFDGTRIAQGECPLYSPEWDREEIGSVLPPEDDAPGWDAWLDQDTHLDTCDHLDAARAEVDSGLQTAGWVTP